MASKRQCRRLGRLLQSSSIVGASETICYARPVRSSCIFQAVSKRHSSTAGIAVRLGGGVDYLQNSPGAQGESAAVLTQETLKKVASAKTSPYRMSSAMVISRPPMLTRDLTEFEKAYFFYQKRLDKRLALPFNQEFYFREGTLSKEEWIRKQASLDKYDPKGYDAWMDELLIGQKHKDDEEMSFDELIKNTVTGEEITEHDTEEEIAAKKALDKPLERVNKAELEGDERTLNRKMSRTIYLLIQTKGLNGDIWTFPQVDLIKKENLGTAAVRALFDSCGMNMNIWQVGNAPIAFHTEKFTDAQKKEQKDDKIGRKVFFMKARILAGQANIKNNILGAKDFKWLAREEIEKIVAEEYWESIKHIIVNR